MASYAMIALLVGALVGARCVPGLTAAFDEFITSRPTGTFGGCGCTNELVTSMRNGHGPCTWSTLNPGATRSMSMSMVKGKEFVVD